MPNPSFEEYSSCPDSYTIISYSIGWNSYANTPDYFNICATDLAYSVPNNGWGNQNPFDGSAYAGLWAYYYPYSINGREFIGIKLKTPLILGEKYYISFKVSLSDLSNCGINKLGCLFLLNSINPINVNNNPHIYCLYPIIDKNNWTTISGSFVADSSYKYIVIGNFFDDFSTDTIVCNGSDNCLSYYFIDDVCVSTDSLTCNPLVIINENTLENDEINIYPNPTNNILNVKWNNLNISPVNIYLYDIYGNLIKQMYIENPQNIDISKYTKGIYILKIKTNNNTLNKKIIIY